MSPQLKTLIWKEWRQQRKYFWVVLLLLVGFEVAFLMINPEMSMTLFMMSVTTSPFLAIVIGSQIVVSETSLGTDTFFQSLPANRRLQAWVKLFVGAFVLIGPLIISYAIYGSLLFVLDSLNAFSPESRHDLFQGQGKDESFYYFLFRFCMLGLSFALAFYIWTVSIAANCRTFIKACGLGILNLVMWVFNLSVSSEYVLSITRESPSAARDLYLVAFNAINPLLGVIFVDDRPSGLSADWDVFQSFPGVLILSGTVGVYSYLILRFVRLFGTEAKPSKKDLVERVTSKLSSVWETRRTARLERAASNATARSPSITWLLLMQQVRSHKWLLLLLLFLGCYMGVVPVFNEWSHSGLYYLKREVVSILSVLFLIIGLPAALLLGTTTLMQDRSVEVQSFWRSLPFSPLRWLLTKYAVTFLMALLCLLGPYVLMNIFFEAYGWPTIILLRGTLFLLAHFTLAATMFWMVGNPVQSMVLTVGYSAVVQAVVVTIIQRGLEFVPFNFFESNLGLVIEVLVTKDNEIAAGAFYLILVLMFIPSLSLLFSRARQYRLSAW
ncbi:ABC-2 family transporter protein [Polystyrenella longa]|uniref:ABC-2 family transporter protein n=1 Tax=Polystyrenella longa TaxID=2528007 RepID=A0A518CST8_9PLAN|nr:hypothetical protein [Polystyrenella longa]QDU82275.1 ABC-2 family transporter protein [Polystyrenella longa]